MIALPCPKHAPNNSGLTGSPLEASQKKTLKWLVLDER